MKKYLFIQDHLHGGGAEQITVDVAEHLARRGHQVTLLLLDATNIRIMIPDNLCMIYFNIHADFMKGAIKRKKIRYMPEEQRIKFANIIQEFNADVIIAGHSHAFWLAPLLPKNTWFWGHGDIFGLTLQKTFNPIKQLEYLKKFYQCKKACQYLFNNRRLITVNENLANQLKQNVPNCQVTVIHNGIDEQRLLSQTQQQSVIEKVWQTIFVGRLTPEKQPHVAIQAFADSGLTGRMAIVGDGILLNDLKLLVKKLHIEQNIDFLGWQANPSTFIQQSQSLILSSRTEGSPLIVAESIILGIPVVAFHCSEGVYYQLNSGKMKQGLVPLNDTKALSQRLYEVVTCSYPITENDKSRLKIDKMIDSFEKLM